MRCRRWLIGAAAVLAAAALWLGAWKAAVPIQEPALPSPLWILGDDGGRLAQYEYAHTDGEPVRTWPVYTALLPQADCERLRRGIPVYSEEELRRLVEDLGG
ncbi:MAG: hypothetical protein IJ412_11425 [Oscillospiraceae bacterium]|nr:hypothetical protein [Oscillospiraceae bacterium]